MTSLTHYFREQKNTVLLSKWAAPFSPVPTLNLSLIPPWAGWVRVPHCFWSWTKWPQSFLCSPNPIQLLQCNSECSQRFNILFYSVKKRVWGISGIDGSSRGGEERGEVPNKRRGLWGEWAQDNSATLCNLNCRWRKSKKLFCTPNTYH